MISSISSFSVFHSFSPSPVALLERVDGVRLYALAGYIYGVGGFIMGGTTSPAPPLPYQTQVGRPDIHIRRELRSRVEREECSRTAVSGPLICLMARRVVERALISWLRIPRPHPQPPHRPPRSAPDLGPLFQELRAICNLPPPKGAPHVPPTPTPTVDPFTDPPGIPCQS